MIGPVIAQRLNIPAGAFLVRWLSGTAASKFPASIWRAESASWRTGETSERCSATPNAASSATMPASSSASHSSWLRPISRRRSSMRVPICDSSAFTDASE